MEFLLNLRRRGIADRAVLRAMDEVPREQFVAPETAGIAYADQALPIDCGQTISQPYVVAYMTEQLDVAAAPPRARSRHRLGLSGRRAVAAGARGGEHRALSHARRRRRARACRRSATIMSRWWRATALPACRPRRRSTASSSPPRPRRCRRRWSISSPTTASCCCRSGRIIGAQHIVKLTKSQTGIAREQLIAGAFRAAAAGAGEGTVVFRRHARIVTFLSVT